MLPAEMKKCVLGPCQTYMIELSCKNVKCLKTRKYLPQKGPS